MRALFRPFVAATSAVAVAVLLTGCGKDAVPQDALDAVVVEVGESKLTGKMLEQWLLKSPTPPVGTTAGLLIGSWIDAALLQEAKAKGIALDDSALVDAAIGPDAARGNILEFWAGRASARPAVTDAQADSLGKRDNVRVLQHFFLAIPQGSDSMTVVGIANRARGILQRARAGEDFTALVKEASQDSATLGSNGYLPAISREDLPAPIRNVAWGLEPGAVSVIIPSGLGLHIVRRATPAESRVGYKAWLAPRFSRRADSVFVDSVTRARQVVIPADAVERIRSMAPEPVKVAEGGPLATWQGGELSPSQARTWLVMLQAPERAALAGASDSAVKTLIRELAQREIILGLAGASHEVSPKARGLLAPQFKAAVAEVTEEFNRRTASASGATAATAFVDSLINGPARYRPLPGALGGVLRARIPVTVNNDAIAAVLKATQTLWAELHANDSTAPAAPAPTGKAPGAPAAP
ncbi:MAG TPA: peptidylprolyl isomerase [Gemmatimonadales bacterium]|jgi:hypothetical protein|nr:peptidylprolyl isomerase [Gemmatimonadales bacterium]